MFEQELHEEQCMFEKHMISVRTWASKVHADSVNHHNSNLAIDAVMTQHIQSHFPILNLKDANAAKQAVGVCIDTYADKVGVLTDDVYRVIVANLSYIDGEAGAWIMDTAKLVGDLIAANPSCSCAIVIYPNARKPSASGNKSKHLRLQWRWVLGSAS